MNAELSRQKLEDDLWVRNHVTWFLTQSLHQGALHLTGHLHGRSEFTPIRQATGSNFHDHV